MSKSTTISVQHTYDARDDFDALKAILPTLEKSVAE